jgi:hypothetical protein
MLTGTASSGPFGPFRLWPTTGANRVADFPERTKTTVIWGPTPIGSAAFSVARVKQYTEYTDGPHFWRLCRAGGRDAAFATEPSSPRHGRGQERGHAQGVGAEQPEGRVGRAWAESCARAFAPGLWEEETSTLPHPPHAEKGAFERHQELVQDTLAEMYREQCIQVSRPASEAPLPTPVQLGWRGPR